MPSFSLLEDKYSPIIYTTALFYPRFFGSASSLPDKTKIDCSKNIINHLPSWLKEVPKISDNKNGLLHEAPDNYVKHRWETETKEIDENVFRRQVCKGQKDGYHQFGGRCTDRVSPMKTRRITASMTQSPTCDNNDNNIQNGDLTFDGMYLKHINSHRKPFVLSNCDCPKVPSVPDVITAAGERRLETPDYLSDRIGCHGYQDVDYHRHGLCVESYAGFTAFVSSKDQGYLHIYHFS